MNKESTIKNSQIIKQFWLGMGNYKMVFWLCFVLFTIATSLNMFVPVYYKQFFDILGNSVEKSPVVSSLTHVIFIILAIHLISWISFQVSMRIYNKMESGVMAKLKQKSFNYLILHSYGFFTNNFTGSLVQRVNRFSRSFERLADSIVFNLLPLFITVVASIAVTWVLAPMVSLVIIIWVVIYSIFNISFSRWKMKYDIEVSKADSSTTGVLSDNITNHNAITLFGGYEKESQYYKEVTDDQAKKTSYSWTLGQYVDMTQAFLIYMVEFVVFYYTIKFWDRGLATIGTFVLIQVYIIGLAQQLWGLNRIVRGIYESLADSKEMVEILLLDHEVRDIPRAKELSVRSGVIEFVNVIFSFNKTREVLHKINLNIGAGEKVAFVGPSGAGKTTLIKLILRLYDLAGGTILIDKQDIKDVTQESLRKNISLVPQDPVLFHRTLLENIRYGKHDATDEEVKRAAKLAHCDEFIDLLPLKYDTFVGERGVKLSGGERQRVAIARAILKNAPILILDEATSSLDSNSESLIQDALDNLMRDRTTIVIAHRLSTIRKMDRIVVLDKGTITEQGTHDELINKDDGLYKILWNLQAGGFITDEG
ncbi:MAG: ABC transporter ATP-binding protein [Candidatus Paceibacterota bacterium]|jgi:ATP-binding cassette subfamily B protein